MDERDDLEREVEFANEALKGMDENSEEGASQIEYISSMENEIMYLTKWIDSLEDPFY